MRDAGFAKPVGFLRRIFGQREFPRPIQADHYIIRLLPPVWGITSQLVSQILTANNCVAGDGVTDVDVTDRARNKAYSMLQVQRYERRSQRTVDPAKTRVIEFGGELTGTIVAVVAKAGPHDPNGPRDSEI